jgi:multidrug efflux pump subunit AcrB
MLTGKIGTDFMAVSDNGRLNIKIELLQGARVEETA